jgi:NAD(P)-dependent dehydrogenase (short-subunit alcohol dehydrogenase family)
MLAFLELLDAGNKKAMAGGFGAPLGPDRRHPAIQSQVLFTASIAGFSRAKWTSPVYGSSKAALIWLTKHASSNLGPHGIRANALAPGLFPSELAANLIGTRDPDREDAETPSFIPAHRFGGLEEMAGTVVYLAGRPGAFNNGLILVCDGGRLGQMPSQY